MIKRFKLHTLINLVSVVTLLTYPVVVHGLPNEQAAGSSSGLTNASTPLLRVSQNLSSEDAAAGEVIHHELTVQNISSTESAANVRLLNRLPARLTLKNGSVLLNSASAVDPLISNDGKAFIFKIGTLPPNRSATIRFTTITTPDSQPSKIILYASAISSGGGTSNIAKTDITFNKEHKPVQAKADSIETPAPASLPTADIKPAEPVPVTVPVPVPVPTTEATIPKAPAIVPEIPTQKPEETAPEIIPPSLPEKLSPPEPAKIISTVENDIKKRFVIPESQTLSDLIGASTLQMLSDIDGQFLSSITKNKIFENENAKPVEKLTLLDSVRAGRSFSRESLASLARKEQAKAQTGQAFGLLLPSVSVRASYGSEISQPGVQPNADGKDQYSEHARTDLALTVRQPLLDMPTFLDWRRREVIEKIRGENYRVSDSDAYISTLNSYLNLVSSRIQIDMTRDFETQLSELLTYIEKRTKAGAASISDLSRVKARNQATRSFRLEQEASHAAAGIEFITLTNLVPKTIQLPVLEDVEISQLPKSFDTAVATAMNNNPEITSLTAELQAATMDKSSAKGRYLPRIDAEFTDTFALGAGGSTKTSGQRDRRLMMVMNWNLFSGGSDYNNIIERSERQKELQYKLDDQRRRIVQTLSSNYATLDTTRKRISAGYNELKAISTAADAMSKRMLSGNQSLLDLLDVYDRYYQIRSRLVSLHVLEISTVAQLVRLTLGTPGKSAEIKIEPGTSKK